VTGQISVEVEKMDIFYVGHSCFKLRGKQATIVMDPYQPSVGFEMPRISADIVTISHDHEGHNNVGQITGTTRRKNPFVIDTLGEYEVGGVGVFGVATWHDDMKGEERGRNLVCSVLIDGVSVVHLGDLGHKLTEKQVSMLNGVDVLLCPVGGVTTIGPKRASEVISMIEPAVFIPMHYKTPAHDEKVFGELMEVEAFLSEMSVDARREEKLTVSRVTMPEELEVVVLSSKQES